MSFPGTDILLAHYILQSPLQDFGFLSKTFMFFRANVHCGPSLPLSGGQFRCLADVVCLRSFRSRSISYSS